MICIYIIYTHNKYIYVHIIYIYTHIVYIYNVYIYIYIIIRTYEHVCKVQYSICTILYYATWIREILGVSEYPRRADGSERIGSGELRAQDL